MMMNNNKGDQIMTHMEAVTTVNKLQIGTAIEAVVRGLNEEEDQREFAQHMKKMGGTWDHWHIKKEGKKFIYLDCGGSGAFLIEKATGELYNIKAYGVPDYNKKQKADIGNVLTVDPKVLHTKRWNYLR
jgi:hypothetical protein